MRRDGTTTLAASMADAATRGSIREKQLEAAGTGSAPRVLGPPKEPEEGQEARELRQPPPQPPGWSSRKSHRLLTISRDSFTTGYGQSTTEVEGKWWKKGRRIHVRLCLRVRVARIRRPTEARAAKAPTPAGSRLDNLDPVQVHLLPGRIRGGLGASMSPGFMSKRSWSSNRRPRCPPRPRGCRGPSHILRAFRPRAVLQEDARARP